MGEIAMINVTVKIEGLAALQRALNELPLELQRGPVRKAVSSASQIIRKEAIQNASVHKKTGSLEKAIVTMASRRKVPGQFEYAVGVRRGEAKKYVNSAKNRKLRRVGKKYYPEGPNFYWRFLEFGSRHQKRTPFLVPAFESKKGQAVNHIKNRIAADIERIAQRLRGRK